MPRTACPRPGRHTEFLARSCLPRPGRGEERPQPRPGSCEHVGPHGLAVAEPVLEAPPRQYQRPEDLQNIYVRSASGGSVPISAFTRVETLTAPLAVNHQGQFPTATVSFYLAPGVSLGDAV